MYSEGVLFLLITNEIEHLLAIGVSLSEQSQYIHRHMNSLLNNKKRIMLE
ncbi:MAG: hypothetical protein H0X50_01965 [Nitrosopumilus sp.]|nr:hypothetical protein [Nitrosopumilus sp.]